MNALQTAAMILADNLLDPDTFRSLADVRVEGETVTFTLDGERFCAVVEYDEDDTVERAGR